MADADLREAGLAGDHGQPLLVLAVFPAMHQDDGERIEAIGAQCGESGPCRPLVELCQHRAVGADALGDLDDPGGQLFGQHDMTREDFGPRLIADPQCVAKPARDRQRQPFALALEQGVGRHCGPDPQFGDRCSAILVHQPPDRLARGIGIMVGVFGQELVGHQRPGGGHRDDIGKSPPAIDREAPGAGFRFSAHEAGFARRTNHFKRFARKTGVRRGRPPPFLRQTHTGR